MPDTLQVDIEKAVELEVEILEVFYLEVFITSDREEEIEILS